MIGPRSNRIAAIATVIALVVTTFPVSDDALRDFSPTGLAEACHPTPPNHHLNNQTSDDPASGCLVQTSERDLQIDLQVCKPHCGGAEMATLQAYPNLFKLDGGNGSWPERTGDTILVRFNVTNRMRDSTLNAPPCEPGPGPDDCPRDPHEAWDFYVTVRDLDGIVVGSTSEFFRVNGTVAGQQSGCDNARFPALAGTNASRCFMKSLRAGATKTIEMRYDLATPESQTGVHRIQIRVDAGADVCERGEISPTDTGCLEDESDHVVGATNDEDNNVRYLGIVVGKKPDIGIVSIGGTAWETYHVWQDLDGERGPCLDYSPGRDADGLVGQFKTRQVPAGDLYAHYRPYCTFFNNTYVVNWGDFPTVFANSTVDLETGTMLANTSWIAAPVHVKTICTGVQPGTSPSAFCNKKVAIITDKWMEPRILDTGAEFSGNRSASNNTNIAVPALDLSTAAGTFTVGFQVDPDKYFPAPTPENDTTTREITVAGADLVASMLGLQSTPYAANAPITFTLKVTNAGDWPAGGAQSRTNSSSAKFTVTIWRDTKDSTPLSPTPWNMEKLGANNGTAENEATLAFNNLTAAAAGGGSHKIIVELDTADIIAEKNETNTYEFPFLVVDTQAPIVQDGFLTGDDDLFPALNYTEPRYRNNNSIVYCYNDVGASPPQYCKGGFVRINASITDNDVNLASVAVNLTYPNGTTLQHNMTRIGSSTNYFLNRSYDQKGVHSYRVIATDPSENRGQSATARTFTVVSFPKDNVRTFTEPADRVEFNGTNWFNVTFRLTRSGHNVADATDPTRVNITFANSTGASLYSGRMGVHIDCFRDAADLNSEIECTTPPSPIETLRRVTYYLNTSQAPANIDLTDPDTDIGSYGYAIFFTDPLNDTLRSPEGNTNQTIRLVDSIPAIIENTVVAPANIKAPQTLKINTTVIENVMVRNATIVIKMGTNEVVNTTITADTSTNTLQWLRTATNGSGNYTYSSPTGRETPFAVAGSYSYRISVTDANRTVTSATGTFMLTDDKPPVFDEAQVGVTPIKQEVNGNVTIYAKVTDETNFTVTAVILHANSTTNAAERIDATLTDEDGDGNYTFERTYTDRGSYSVVITATDSAGLDTSLPTNSFEIVLNLAPLYSKEQPAAGGFGSLKPLIRVEVRDAANGVEEASIGLSIQREGGAATPVDAQKTTLTNGYRISFQVTEGFRPGELVSVLATAKDLSPDRLQSFFNWTFRVDGLPPEPNLVLDPEEVQGETTLISDKTRLNFSGVDLDAGGQGAASGVAFIEFTVERGTTTYSERVNASTASLRLGQLPVFAGEGSYKISYSATDNVGNPSSKRTKTVLVVTTPPAVTSQSTVDGHVTAVATSPKDVPISSVVLFAKAGGEAGYTRVPMVKDSGTTWSADLPVKPKGTLISYYVQAEDKLENVGRDRDLTTPNNLRVANHQPKIELLTPKAGDMIGSTYRVQWTATDVDSADTLTITIDYRPKGSTGEFILVRERLPNTGSTLLNTSQLPDGDLELRVRANDGTADGSTSVQVTVDNKKSLVEPGPAPPATEVGQPVTLQASVGKAATSVEARISRGGADVQVVQLNDAGENGDATPGDGIWSGRVALESAGNYKVNFFAKFTDGGEAISTDSVSFTVTGGSGIGPGGSLFAAAMVILAAATVGLAAMGLRRRK